MEINDLDGRTFDSDQFQATWTNLESENRIILGFVILKKSSYFSPFSVFSKIQFIVSITFVAVAKL